jgi:uncharacterized membrane protein
MRLLTVHKVLICAALAFFLFFGISQISKESGSAALGIGSIAVALGVGTYFVWVVRGGYERKQGG